MGKCLLSSGVRQSVRGFLERCGALFKSSNVKNWAVYLSLLYVQAFISAMFCLAVERVEVMACKMSEVYKTFVVGV